MKKEQTKRLSYKLISAAGKTLIRILEFFITLTTKNEIYFLATDFPWVKNIESDYPKIKEEFLKFMNGKNKPLDICKISEEQFKVVEENQWDFIPLYFYGTKISTYENQFKHTFISLDKIPDLTTAFFSIIKPGTFIKEHRGAYKGYLRYQLGIQIPQPEELCGLKVENQLYHWTEGKSVIFDDTYLHTAWNNSNEYRAVLYVDFIRPMNKPLVYISRLLTNSINKSPFVQNAIFNLNTEINNEVTSST